MKLQSEIHSVVMHEQAVGSRSMFTEEMGELENWSRLDTAGL